MPAPLSVVIPTLNAQDCLPATLVSLSEGLESGLIADLVIADGGSKDATLKIADDAGATIVKTKPGRGGQMAAGAVAAKGDWVLFLHADSQLSPGWTTHAAHHLAMSQKAGYFKLRFAARGMAPAIVSAWANIRSKFGLPYGDQALLIKRSLYQQVGGYLDIPLMEDVAIIRALRGNLQCLSCSITTSAARYQAEGWVRRGGKNIGLLVQYLLGRNPEILAKKYNKRR